MSEELDDVLPPLTLEEQKIIKESLMVGATRALAARAAGRQPDELERLAAADEQLERDLDQVEALGIVNLLKAAGQTRPLEVLARTRPGEFGTSVARPLLGSGDEEDDDGRLNLDDD